jgi:hypothetical protein
MTLVLGHNIIRKEVYRLLAGAAQLPLYPQKVLDLGVWIATVNTCRLIEIIYFRPYGSDNLLSNRSEGLTVELGQLLAHNPVGHRVYISTNHMASQAIGF